MFNPFKIVVFRLCFCLIILILSTILPVPALTQIITDGSLGPKGERLQGPDYIIRQNLGKKYGSNLFHSFEEFNINPGEKATFKGTNDIQRVISRVTGGKLSNIDGLLKSEILDADFFLINPAGFIFGPNATIDINGSFNISTADYLKLGEKDTFFSQPMANEVFSAEAPTAFGFLGANIGNITFHDANLVAANSESISVIGRDIQATETMLKAPSGNIHLVSTKSQGEVKLTKSESSVTAIDTESFAELGDIALSSDTHIDVSGASGGQIILHADNLTVKSSKILSRTTGGNDGQDIDVRLRGILTLLDGGEIDITTEKKGHSGTIDIRAEGIRIKGNDSELAARSLHDEKGGGQGGTIIIDTGELEIANGGQISVSTQGTGKGGSLDIKANQILIKKQDLSSDSTVTDGQKTRDTGLFSKTSFKDNGGNGGSISITTKELQISRGGEIDITTEGTGNGGMLKIDAQKSITLNGMGSSTQIVARTTFSGDDNGINGGDAGNIDISTGELKILNGGIISTTTLGTGKGGTLKIDAEKSIILDGMGSSDTEIAARTLFTGEEGGDGGSIEIETGELKILNGGIISATSQGRGDGGMLTINAKKSITLDGQGTPTQIVARSVLNDQGKGGEGNAGNILINTGQLEVLNGGQISATTRGTGNGGMLSIVADSILVDGSDPSSSKTDVDTEIVARTFFEDEGAGDAGSIMIDTDGLTVVNGGQISATTRGTGDGGSLDIDANTILIDGRNSDSTTGLLAQSLLNGNAGKAGDISVNSTNLNIIRGGEISAQTEGDARQGNIMIDTTDDINLSDGATIKVEGKETNGGNITIRSTELIMENDSNITAEAKENGGDITINSDAIVLQDSSLRANAELANGGNVFINTKGFFANKNGTFRTPQDEDVIDVSSERGISGSIQITRPDIDLTGGLVPLDEELIDVNDWSFAKCSTKSQRQEFSTFFVTGQEGISITPDDLLPGFSPFGQGTPHDRE